MKKLIIAAVAMTACTGSAYSADMPVKAVPMLVPAYSWNGFYAGVNIGYSWGRAENDPNGVSRTQVSRGIPPEVLIFDTGTIAAPVGASTTDVDGWLGGGQAGWNWQRGVWLWGVEGDIQATGQRGRTDLGFVQPSFAIPGAGALPPFVGTASGEYKLNWFATVRPRLGFLPTERLVLYATGGLAVGQVETNYGTTIVGIGTFAIANKLTRTGWTAGVGAEGALWGNWTAKIEYLYVDLGSFNTVGPSGTLVLPNVPIPGHTTVTTFSSAPTVRFTDNIIRAGLNYRYAPGMP